MKKDRNKMVARWRKSLAKQALSLLVGMSISITSYAQDIQVYAASSMTDVIDQLALQFERQTGNKVTTVFAGSATLARQIEQGAPADVFISANPKWMEYLITKKRIAAGQVTRLVSNQLVLIAHQGESLPQLDQDTFAQLPELLAEQRLAIGEPNSVPVGMYAQQSLQSLGLWSQLAAKTAPSSNVRLTLSLVERGEAPLGIVYKTDALRSDKVTVVGVFADNTHAAIEYPAAALNQEPASQAFMAFLNTQLARDTFIELGFTPLTLTE